VHWSISSISVSGRLLKERAVGTPSIWTTMLPEGWENIAIAAHGLMPAEWGYGVIIRGLVQVCRGPLSGRLQVKILGEMVVDSWRWRSNAAKVATVGEGGLLTR
jgi:hypothetical protein